MGELAQLEKNHRQAIRLFEQALKLGEKPEYRLNLGNAHYFAGDYAGAIRILSFHLAANPDDGHARLNLANCHLRLGELDKAKDLCREGLDRGLPPASLWNALGQAHFLQDDFEEAKAWFERAYDAAPDSVDALFNRANASFRLGRLREAAEDYAQCVRKDENFEPAWLNRAVVCLELENLEEALRSVEGALRVNPQNVDSRYLQARIRLESRESRLARDDLREALRLQPDHVPSLLAMARVCLLEEEKAAALDWSKRVLLRSPLPGEEAVLALGLMAEMGEYEACLQAILRSKIPVKGGRAAFLKVVCLWKIGKVRDAISELEALLGQEGEDTAEAFTLLGILLQETGALALAESRYRQALAKQPGALRASQELGALLASRGEADSATEILQGALEAHPDQPDLLYNLACSQARAGNLDDAWTSLRRAVEHGFDDAGRLMDDADLKPLREMKEFTPLLG
jgi:tetratricopeptide (TPR) repeat protein